MEGCARLSYGAFHFPELASQTEMRHFEGMMLKNVEK